MLSALGTTEREIALGDVPPEKRGVRRPLGGLSAHWLSAADDGSREYRLALSLVHSLGDRNETVSIRPYMEPVRWTKGAWRWGERGGHVVWTGSDLARNLGAILIRRMMDVDDAGENPPSRGSVVSTSLADIAAFMTGKTDDQKLEDLIWGLALVGNQTSFRPSPYHDEEFILPRAYALLKLTLLPGSLEWEEHHGVMALQLRQSSGGETPTGVSVRPEPATLAQLLVGHISEACSPSQPAGFGPPASSRSRPDSPMAPVVTPNGWPAASLQFGCSHLCSFQFRDGQ